MQTARLEKGGDGLQLYKESVEVGDVFTYRDIHGTSPLTSVFKVISVGPVKRAL